MLRGPPAQVTVAGRWRTRWQMGSKITVDSATLMNKGAGGDRGALALQVELSAVRSWSTPSRSSLAGGCVDRSAIAQMGFPTCGCRSSAFFTGAPLLSAPAGPGGSRAADGRNSQYRRFPCLALAYGGRRGSIPAPQRRTRRRWSCSCRGRSGSPDRRDQHGDAPAQVIAVRGWNRSLPWTNGRVPGPAPVHARKQRRSEANRAISYDMWIAKLELDGDCCNPGLNEPGLW